MTRQRITNQQYIDEIKRVAKLLNTDYVSTNDYDKYAKYSSGRASQRFGSWANYAKTAGLKNREENDDITGQTFTRLKVIGKTGKKNKYGNYLWKCECSCSEHNIVYATIHDLRVKTVQSCGCLAKEVLARPEQREALKEGYEKKTHKSGLRYPDFKRDKRNDNTSGYTGVTKKRNKWMAQLVVKGKRYSATGFDTPEDAYYKGRLKLEEEYLPEDFRNKIKEDKNNHS